MAEFATLLFRSENMQEFDTEYCVKRCIAIEGDTVMYERVIEGGETEVVHLVVPEGHSWLESDNHNFQAGQLPDSLLFGPISNENIWGRVVWCRDTNQYIAEQYIAAIY